MFLKLNEIGRLQGDRIRSQLRGRQAGRDGCTQEVHRGVAGQAEKLPLRVTGTWTEKAGRDPTEDSSLPQVCARGLEDENYQEVLRNSGFKKKKLLTERSGSLFGK